MERLIVTVVPAPIGMSMSQYAGVERPTDKYWELDCRSVIAMLNRVDVVLLVLTFAKTSMMRLGKLKAATPSRALFSSRDGTYTSRTCAYASAISNVPPAAILLVKLNDNNDVSKLEKQIPRMDAGTLLRAMNIGIP